MENSRQDIWGKLEVRLARRHSFFWMYTVVFVVLLFAACMPLWINGKGLIREVDGLSMLYTNFVWIGRWIREVFANIFVNHSFTIPMWTTDLGYGSDVLLVIGSGLINPFYWVSALVPERFAEYAFSFVIVLRLYLAGFAFAAYSFHHGNGRFVTFAGSLAYVFAGSTVIVFSQPGFIESMIIFPLLLLAADWIFDGKSPVFFVVMCVYIFASSYYTGYMMCLFLLGYCLLRYFVVEGRRSLKELAKLFFKFVFYLLIGVLVAALFFLPVLMSMTGMERLNLERYIPMFYNLGYYVGLVTGFISYHYTLADSYIGFNALMPSLVFVLFLRRRENKGLFIAFLAMTTIFLFPQLGSMMNGFQYPANRWSWAYDFCGAYVLVKMLPQLATMTKKEKRILAALLGAYGLVVLVLAYPSAGGLFFIIYAVMVAALVVLLSSGRFTVRQGQVVAVAAILLSGFVNYFYYLSPTAGGYVYNQVGLTRAYSMETERSSSKLLEGVADDTEWRYDRSGTSFVFNNSLFIGRQGTDFYINMYNSNVDAFHKSLGLPWSIAFQYAGEDARSALDALLGVKYYIDPIDDDVYLPYLFRDGEVIASDESVQAELHRASACLPLAFAYDKTVSRESFETLDAVQKQEVLMQAGVVESAEDATEVTLPRTTSYAIGYDLKVIDEDKDDKTDSIEVADSALIVNKPDSSVELTFDAPANCELYLEASGLDFASYTLRQQYSDEEWASIGLVGRNSVLYDTALAGDVYDYMIDVQCGDAENSVVGRTYKSHMYGGTKGWVVNLGYDEAARTTMRVTFSQAGVYSYDDLRVLVQPMDSFDKQLDALASVVPTSFSYEGNVIEGSIGMPDERYLYISVPYSAGWSATVDGQPVELERMNIGFMGIKMQAGEHEFLLTYETPYIREGAVVSLVGLVLFAGLLLWQRTRRRRRARGGADDGLSRVDASDGLRQGGADGR